MFAGRLCHVRLWKDDNTLVGHWPFTEGAACAFYPTLLPNQLALSSERLSHLVISLGSLFAHAFFQQSQSTQHFQVVSGSFR